MNTEPKTIITQNGTTILVDRTKHLDDDFCEQAIDYYCEKHNCGRAIMNTYLSNKAIEEYIVDNNLQPIYE